MVDHHVEMLCGIAHDLRTDGLPALGDELDAAADAMTTLTAERDALKAENERLREAGERAANLLRMVSLELQGRVEGGKLAAIQQARDVIRAALRTEEGEL